MTDTPEQIDSLAAELEAFASMLTPSGRPDYDSLPGRAALMLQRLSKRIDENETQIDVIGKAVVSLFHGGHRA